MISLYELYHLGVKRRVNMIGIFTATDLLNYATSLVRDARLRELAQDEGQYGWLRTKQHGPEEEYFTDLLPVILKMTPESCTAVAVKLDAACGQDMSMSSDLILSTLKDLLREQDSINILAGNVKRAKETKYRKVKVHPMLDGRQATVSFVVYSDKV